MKKNTAMILCALYAFLMLLILGITVWSLLGALRRHTKEQTLFQTEPIYVFTPREEDSTDIEETAVTDASFWVIKAYEERIGIFSSEGVLLDVLDTYVKTLPKADRRLPEEGITAHTKEALNSLIEDYSH